MNTPSAATRAHLTRLRVRLTVVYAVVASLALFIFSFLVINSDRTVRIGVMEQDLLTQAQTGANALFLDEDGDLVDDRYIDAGFTNGYPQTWVVERDYDDLEDEETVTPVVAPDSDWFPEADATGLALSILDESTPWVWGIWGGDADPALDLYARGVPIADADGENVYAVYAIGNLPEWMEGHGALRARVWLIAALLVVLSAAAGYWVAGRSIEPAAESLTQQERLIGDAAHELRTPIARIRSAAEGGLAGDEDLGAALERVERVADRAGGLIDDLLVLARMDADREAFEPEPLRLDLLAEAVADEYERVDVEAVPTVVEGDANLLRRAIINLVANAVRHGRRDDPDVPITVTVYPNLVRVHDGGPGIDEALNGQLFERFRTGDRSDGHGLGLPIVRWIADVHDGEIDVADDPRGGVAATLRLPEA